MTPAEFTALAELVKLRGGASEAAARLVLVDEASHATAMLATGLTWSGVGNAVARCNRVLALARKVVGAPPPKSPKIPQKTR